MGRCTSSAARRRTPGAPFLCRHGLVRFLRCGEVHRFGNGSFLLPRSVGILSNPACRSATVKRVHLRDSNSCRCTLSATPVCAQKCGLDAISVRCGTVEQRVFEKIDAVPFLVGSRLRLLISCREDASRPDSPAAYAIAATLEGGTYVAIDIYDEIRTRVRPVVQVEATTYFRTSCPTAQNRPFNRSQSIQSIPRKTPSPVAQSRPAASCSKPMVS